MKISQSPSMRKICGCLYLSGDKERIRSGTRLVGVFPVNEIEFVAESLVEKHQLHEDIVANERVVLALINSMIRSVRPLLTQPHNELAQQGYFENICYGLESIDFENHLLYYISQRLSKTVIEKYRSNITQMRALNTKGDCVIIFKSEPINSLRSEI